MKSRVLLLATTLTISVVPFISLPVAPYPISADTDEREEEPLSRCPDKLSCDVWQDMGEVLIPLGGSENNSDNTRTVVNTFCNKDTTSVKLEVSLEVPASQSGEWLFEDLTTTLAPNICATSLFAFTPKSSGTKTAKLLIFRQAGNETPVPKIIPISGVAIDESLAPVIRRVGEMPSSKYHTHMVVNRDGRLLLGKGSEADLYQTEYSSPKTWVRHQTQTMLPPLQANDTMLCSTERDLLVESGEAPFLNLRENGELIQQVTTRAIKQARPLRSNEWTRLSDDCGSAPGIIRGRVEIMEDGEWRSLCNIFFSEKEARVLCRELGYEFVGHGSDCPGTGSISRDLPSCSGGDENTLMSCFHEKRRYFCDHNNDVVVSCKTVHGPYPSQLAMANCPRIKGKVTGHLLVGNHNFRGSVCDTSLSEEAARESCADLGYLKEGAELLQGCQSENDTPPMLNLFQCKSFDCIGDEASIFQCLNECPLTCDEGKPAYLACTPQPAPSSVTPPASPPLHLASVPVRIVHSLCFGERPGFTGGSLEMLYEKEWRTVNYKSFDVKDAVVACRQLGFSDNVGWHRMSRGCGYAYDPYKDPSRNRQKSLYTKLECTGREASLWDCPKSLCEGENHCSDGESIQLLCQHHLSQKRVPRTKGCGNGEISNSMPVIYLQSQGIYERVWETGQTRKIQTIESLIQPSPDDTVLWLSPNSRTLLLHDGTNLQLFSRHSEESIFSPSSSPLPTPLLALAGRANSMTAYGLTEGEQPELIHITMDPNGNGLTAVRLGQLNIPQSHLLAVSDNNWVYVSNGNRVIMFDVNDSSLTSLPVISPLPTTEAMTPTPSVRKRLGTSEGLTPVSSKKPTVPMEQLSGSNSKNVKLKKLTNSIVDNTENYLYFELISFSFLLAKPVPHRSSKIKKIGHNKKELSTNNLYPAPR